LAERQLKLAWLRRWRAQLILLALILALPGIAVIVRGGEAVQAITRDGVMPRAALPPPASLAALPACLSPCALPAGGVANLGVYDPDGAFRQSPQVSVQHIYVQWETYDDASLAETLSTIGDEERWPLITVEPWPKQPGGADTLLRDVAGGLYDTEMTALCRTLSAFDRPLFLRWGHEMELEGRRYPWAGRNPAEYVAAYRHVTDECRSVASQIYYVWSPAGNDKLGSYWPGDAYADYVGLSVFGFADWDLTYYGHLRGFEENLSEKYQRASAFDRPIMIAELGITGDPASQATWIRQAQASLSRYPLVRTVVYFNAVDTDAAWGAGFRTPDWRIDPQIFG
jgi:cellulose synthase (UDP-forming)